MSLTHSIPSLSTASISVGSYGGIMSSTLVPTIDTRSPYYLVISDKSCIRPALSLGTLNHLVEINHGYAQQGFIYEFDERPQDSGDTYCMKELIPTRAEYELISKYIREENYEDFTVLYVRYATSQIFRKQTLTTLLSEKETEVKLRMLRYVVSFLYPSLNILLGTSYLIKAAEMTKLETMKILIRYGADVNFQEPSAGLTALYVACCYANIECVQYLLSNGADPYLRVHGGTTIFDHQCVKNSAKLRALLEDPDSAYSEYIDYHVSHCTREGQEYNLSGTFRGDSKFNLFKIALLARLGISIQDLPQYAFYTSNSEGGLYSITEEYNSHMVRDFEFVRFNRIDIVVVHESPHKMSPMTGILEEELRCSKQALRCLHTDNIYLLSLVHRMKYPNCPDCPVGVKAICSSTVLTQQEIFSQPRE